MKTRQDYTLQGFTCWWRKDTKNWRNDVAVLILRSSILPSSGETGKTLLPRHAEICAAARSNSYKDPHFINASGLCRHRFGLHQLAERRRASKYVPTSRSPEHNKNRFSRLISPIHVWISDRLRVPESQGWKHTSMCRDQRNEYKCVQRHPNEPICRGPVRIFHEMASQIGNAGEVQADAEFKDTESKESNQLLARCHNDYETKGWQWECQLDEWGRKLPGVSIAGGVVEEHRAESERRHETGENNAKRGIHICGSPWPCCAEGFRPGVDHDVHGTFQQTGCIANW